MTKAFAVAATSLLDRADVNYAEGTTQVLRSFSAAKYPLVRLGELAENIQYGTSTRAESTPEIGTPVLRMANLQGDRLETLNLKYVELGERDRERYRLQPGDLLVNRTNSKELVGKCAVFNEPGEYVYASYLIRVRVNATAIRPQFLAWFLSTKAGRLQVDRVSRQVIGMANINGEELRELLIPTPPLAVQDLMIAEMEKVESEVETRRQRARHLVETAGARLQALLGIPEAVGTPPRSFAVARSALGASLRLDAAAHRVTTQDKHSAAMHRTFELGEVAQINPRALRVPGGGGETVPYVGLPDCRGTRVAQVGSRPAAEVRSSPIATTDDILFARIEPSIFNKKYVYVDPSIEPSIFTTSSEFYVVRAHIDRILPGYLWALFFTDYVFRQVEGQTTGSSGRRRLPLDKFEAVRIPVPPIHLQRELAERALSERDEAQALIDSAAIDWASAKEAFEVALIGKVAK